MAFTKEELLKMSESELLLAANSAGITLVENGFSASDAIEEILNAQETEEAPATKAAKPATKATKSAAKPAAKPADKATSGKVRLIVHNQEGVESSKFVKVQHNGIMFAIPRETEVTVPQGVVDILNDAIMTRMTYEGGKMVESSARRFPFTVLGPA